MVMPSKTQARSVESGRSPFLPGVQPPAPFTLVIFGATGDLAARKLLPALSGLCRRRLLPERFAIVGVGRRDKSLEDFRADVRAAIVATPEHGATAGRCGDDFLASVFYHRADVTASEAFPQLARHVQQIEAERRLAGNRLFYLAT